MSKIRRRAALLAAVLAAALFVVTGCGKDEGDDDKAKKPSNEWDAMKWDDGKWGAVEPHMDPVVVG